jgi:hypothetical protein
MSKPRALPEVKEWSKAISDTGIMIPDLSGIVAEYLDMSSAHKCAEVQMQLETDDGPRIPRAPRLVWAMEDGIRGQMPPGHFEYGDPVRGVDTIKIQCALESRCKTHGPWCAMCRPRAVYFTWTGGTGSLLGDKICKIRGTRIERHAGSTWLMGKSQMQHKGPRPCEDPFEYNGTCFFVRDDDRVGFDIGTNRYRVSVEPLPDMANAIRTIITHLRDAGVLACS